MKNAGKVRRITVGIKDLKSMLDDFVKTDDAIERGGIVAEESSPGINVP